MIRVAIRPCWTTASWFSISSRRLHSVSRQCCKVYTSWECLSSAATAGTVPGGGGGGGEGVIVCGRVCVMIVVV